MYLAAHPHRSNSPSLPADEREGILFDELRELKQARANIERELSKQIARAERNPPPARAHRRGHRGSVSPRYGGRQMLEPGAPENGVHVCYFRACLFFACYYSFFFCFSSPRYGCGGQTQEPVAPENGVHVRLFLQLCIIFVVAYYQGRI